MEVSYESVEKFLQAKIPQDIEDEILVAYATYNMDHDMVTADLEGYFEDLQLPRQLYRMIRKGEITLEGTDLIDFERLLKCTYHLLIFMDNQDTIDEQWTLLIQASGRDNSFPKVKLRNHVLSIKDMQKISSVVGIDQSTGVIEMVSCATSGKRVYITYLDFAYILGKLGYLRF